MTRRRAGQTAPPPATRRAPVRPGRERELRWLLVVAVVMVVGWWQVTRVQLSAAERATPAGVAPVAINSDGAPEALRAALTAELFEPTEAAFVLERLQAHLARIGRWPNVGELARVTAPAADLDPALQPLLSARARRSGAAEVALLSRAQLRRLKPQLIARTAAEFRSSFWSWSWAALLLLFAVHLLWRVARFEGDQLLLPAVAALVGLGLAIMVSVRDPLRDVLLCRAFAQGIVGGAVVLGVAALIGAQGLRLMRRWSPWAFPAAVLLSVMLALFGTGPGASDAKVNLFGFQPVPAVKLLLVVFLAGYFAQRWEFLREVRERRPRLEAFTSRIAMPKLEYLLPPVLAVGLVLSFFFVQRDLGPALVLAFLFLGLYWAARGRFGLALGGLTGVVAGFGVAYAAGFPRTVTGRIEMWLSPWRNEAFGGDHLAQSLWAFAGGRLVGAGLGRGAPASVPEVHTDLVLAAIGEELGLVGLLVVFGLMSLVLYRVWRAALGARDGFGLFLALGIFLVTGLQVIVIAGGVLGLLPLTGIETPFLSYGRSAMLVNFATLGLAAALSARSLPRGDQGGGDVSLLRGSVRSVGVVVALGLLAIVSRSVWVQVIAADELIPKGALVMHGDGTMRYRYNPRLVTLAAKLERGDIVDRNGVPLATNDADQLAKFAQTFAGSELEPVTIGSRSYPLGGRSYHLLGDVSSRRNFAASNTSFAERDFNVTLQGFDDRPDDDTPGRGAGYRDLRELVPLTRHSLFGSRAARAILDRERHVELALDSRLQVALGDILVRRIAASGAERGAAVVIDPSTGELLASVSVPWPDLSRLADLAPDDPALLDRARYGLYPPGSTFKVVTAIAALRKDRDLAKTVHRCERLDGGRVGHAVRGWGRPIRDDRSARAPHGEVDLEKGLRVSCNAFFAQLATYDVGAAELLRTAALFGIEVASPNTTAALADSLPQAAYGQGQVTATPLEMARVVAGVANRGELAPLRIRIDAPAAGAPTRVLNAREADLLAAALRSVVTDGSAARMLAGARVSIAGKTGTAEVARGRSHAWFIGWAPYASSGRRIAFAVLIEHGGYGSGAAAAAARDLVEEAASLGLLQ